MSQNRKPRTENRRPVIALLVLAFLCSGCTRDDEPSVVLYVSADEHVARQVIDAFEQRTGIRVDFVGDTEAQKTTGLVNRLRAEKDRPQADVFWSSEAFQTVALADEGVLAPYDAPAVQAWPARYRDGQRRWYAFAARARVIVYDPRRIPPEARPRTWMDLTDHRWSGRIVMADPRFGTTGGHLGAMKAYWDRHVMPGYYATFVLGLAENHLRLLPGGNAGVVRAVADGEADLGLTDTDDVRAARQAGRSVAMVYPRHEADAGPGTGTLLIPNTVALVAGAPHPREAGALIDFLLSEQTERLLAESVAGNLPLRPGLAAEYPALSLPDPLDVDYAAAAAARDDAVAAVMRRLGPGAAGEPDAR